MIDRKSLAGVSILALVLAQDPRAGYQFFPRKTERRVQSSADLNSDTDNMAKFGRSRSVFELPPGQRRKESH